MFGCYFSRLYSSSSIPFDGFDFVWYNTNTYNCLSSLSLQHFECYWFCNALDNHWFSTCPEHHIKFWCSLAHSPSNVPNQCIWCFQWTIWYSQMLILISQYAHQSGDSDQKMQHCLDWAGQHATGLIMSNSKVWIDMNSELSSTIYDSYTFLESCLSNNQKHTYLVSYEMVDRYLICDSFKCDKLFRLTHVHWVQKKNSNRTWFESKYSIDTTAQQRA